MMASTYHAILDRIGLWKGARYSSLCCYCPYSNPSLRFSFKTRLYSWVGTLIQNNIYLFKEKANSSDRGLNAQVITQLPDYHRKYGYRTPDDKNETAFQFAIGTKLPYFEWLPTVPEQQDSFNRIMGVSRSERGEPWFDFFPIEERFGSTDPSAPLIVDIGGGLGHDLASLKKQFPSLPGRFILQELPSVINKIEVLDPSIERQTHDAFLPQPVRGARAYYLRTV
jgi:hypothetical protein